MRLHLQLSKFKKSMSNEKSHTPVPLFLWANCHAILQHFFASIEKAAREVDWEPEFDLVSRLADSHYLDFGRGTFRKPADLSTDDMIINRSRVLQN